jgi:hypothetical protein
MKIDSRRASDVRKQISQSATSSPGEDDNTSEDDDDDDEPEPEGNFYHGTPGQNEDYDAVDDNADDFGLENNEDDDNGRPDSPQAGQKCCRHDSNPTQPDVDEYIKAIKVKNSRGKPKADDWEQDVQDVLTKAILHYEIRLATLGFFPDHMQEVAWAKAAWMEGCNECGVKICHNMELIKIVCFRLYFYPILIKYISSLAEEHIFVV